MAHVEAIMTRTGLIVESTGVLVDGAGRALPGVADAVQRLNARGVIIVAIAHDGFTGSLPGMPGPLIPPDATPRYRLPRPGLLLAAAQAQQLDLPTSWVIGTHHHHAHAAAQAGCAGCVLIGIAAPTEDLGLVVVEARDLADAPRVMIPRGGGCWHGH